MHFHRLQVSQNLFFVIFHGPSFTDSLLLTQTNTPDTNAVSPGPRSSYPLTQTHILWTHFLNQTTNLNPSDLNCVIELIKVKFGPDENAWKLLGQVYLGKKNVGSTFSDTVKMYVKYRCESKKVCPRSSDLVPVTFSEKSMVI